VRLADRVDVADLEWNGLGRRSENIEGDGR
jgi:hypothetical protein